MPQIALIRSIALSFPEVTESPHFDKTSFRVAKKIFATCNEAENRITLKFSEADQFAFSEIGKGAIYPVPNKWGKQGWTNLELDKLADAIVIEALKAAYISVAPERLAQQVELNDID